MTDSAKKAEIKTLRHRARKIVAPFKEQGANWLNLDDVSLYWYSLLPDYPARENIEGSRIKQEARSALDRDIEQASTRLEEQLQATGKQQPLNLSTLFDDLTPPQKLHLLIALQGATSAINKNRLDLGDVLQHLPNDARYLHDFITEVGVLLMQNRHITHLHLSPSNLGARHLAILCLLSPHTGLTHIDATDVVTGAMSESDFGFILQALSPMSRTLSPVHSLLLGRTKLTAEMATQLTIVLQSSAGSRGLQTAKQIALTQTIDGSMQLHLQHPSGQGAALSCALTFGETARHLSALFTNKPALTQLELDAKLLTAENLDDWVALLNQKDCGIRTLDFSNQTFTEKEATLIGQLLSRTQKVKAVCLNNTNIGEHLVRIILPINSNAQIKALALQGCELTDNLSATLLRYLATNKSLVRLDLSGNTIGEAILPLALCLVNGLPLTHLALKNASLTTNHILHFMTTIMSKKDGLPMQSLDISGNDTLTEHINGSQLYEFQQEAAAASHRNHVLDANPHLKKLNVIRDSVLERQESSPLVAIMNERINSLNVLLHAREGSFCAALEFIPLLTEPAASHSLARLLHNNFILESQHGAQHQQRILHLLKALPQTEDTVRMATQAFMRLRHPDHRGPMPSLEKQTGKNTFVSYTQLRQRALKLGYQSPAESYSPEWARALTAFVESRDSSTSIAVFETMIEAPQTYSSGVCQIVSTFDHGQTAEDVAQSIQPTLATAEHFTREGKALVAAAARSFPTVSQLTANPEPPLLKFLWPTPPEPVNQDGIYETARSAIKDFQNTVCRNNDDYDELRARMLERIQVAKQELVKLIDKAISLRPNLHEWPFWAGLDTVERTLMDSRSPAPTQGSTKPQLVPNPPFARGERSQSFPPPSAPSIQAQAS